MRGGSVHSSLSIKTTDRSDSAVYTCVATNAFGSADTNINLIIQGLPSSLLSVERKEFVSYCENVIFFTLDKFMLYCDNQSPCEYNVKNLEKS